MCGYARRHISTPELIEYMKLIQQEQWQFDFGADEIQHFYAAFGGAANRKLEKLIIREVGKDVAVDATWWFDCEEEGESLRVNNNRTTFNARNLDSSYWKGAIRHHRGIFLVTGLGEGKDVNGKGRHYLIESAKPILLGCVYRRYSNGCYSAAIITRDSHPRFERYHDKAFPLMLPHDPQFIDLWLSDAREDHPAIADLLAHPKIFNDLKITWVKTLKGGVPKAEPEYLTADEAA